MGRVEVNTQQYIYVTKALASLFHATPDQFMKLLSQDGNIFLRFYWNRVGRDLKLTHQTPPHGLNYEIRHPARNTYIALITLPEPKVEYEAYFVALIYRPDRVTPFRLVTDTTKMLVLEFRLDRDGNPMTVLSEWSKRLKYQALRKGPDPDLEKFYKTVLLEL